MAVVSITQAAKLAGVSRATLYRKYISTGIITVSTNNSGKKGIDTSELLRVFGELHKNGKTVSNNPLDTEMIQPETQAEDSSLVKENDLLKQQLHYYKKLESSFQSQVEELQRDKHWLQSQVSNLAESIKLLEAPISHRYWWQFWK